MIDSIEKLSEHYALIVLSDGTHLKISARQSNWIKVSSPNAAIKKVETDLVGQEAKAFASAALLYKKHEE